MQHDFDLATADANTGVTVRAGVNAMAQALASCSSGATEPSTTYAYQFWADTTSGYMKQRNATNNAWLTRWQLSVGEFAALSGATFTGLVNLAAGANIASAATIDLTAATGNCPRITGTVATSAVTMNTGQQMIVVADGAWPLTYNATTNKLNTGGVSYTCEAGDQILYHKDLSGIVHGIILSTGWQFKTFSKTINITRDISLASGAQVITGVGFPPKSAIFISCVSGTNIMSLGAADTTIDGGLYDANGISAGTYNTANVPISLTPSSGNQANAAVSVWGTDGITLDWTKAGSPTGTATITINFLR